MWLCNRYGSAALVGGVAGRSRKEKAPMGCNLRKGGTAHGVEIFSQASVNESKGAGISHSADAVEIWRPIGQDQALEFRSDPEQ